MLVDGHRTGFDQAQVREHSRFSWFTDHGPRHPTQVVVAPDRSRPESYSWATAPRYGPGDSVMQLGPLAELVIAEDPLTTDLAAAYGISAYLRQLVRWTRGAAHLTLMRGWLDELEDALGEPALETPKPNDIDHDADGFGVTSATRGTLMHWVTLRAGRIRTYQVITPTTWNASRATRTPYPATSNKAWSACRPTNPAAACAHSSWAATTPASSAPPNKAHYPRADASPPLGRPAGGVENPVTASDQCVDNQPMPTGAARALPARWLSVAFDSPT